MYTSLLAVAALTAAPFVAAVGSANVVNYCGFDVTLWSVGGSISPASTLAANGGTYSEQFRVDPQSGGIAIKLTLAPDGLFTSAPQTIFAYSLDGAQVWYDLSDVFGDAFAGQSLVEFSGDTSCPAIVWDNGVPPGGSQVKVCTSDQDVSLILCASGHGW
jgi:hypothetical protein